MDKVGITSIAAYVPYYYVSRRTIGEAWAKKGAKGNRSIINFDEDSVTLAYEAAEDCLQHINREKIDSLYFASTTAPYAEKAHSALVSTALNLRNVFTADFAQCTKASTSALRLALDSCTCGRSKQALLTAADCRNAYPNTSSEQMLGDGAAAVVVGCENIIAVVDAFATTTNEITDIWRNAADTYISVAEERFVTKHGYMTEMVKVVKGIINESGIAIGDIQKFVFTTSNMKDHITLARKLGIEPAKVQDPYLMEVGYTGTAQPLFLLAAAISDAQPGDRILLAAYGNGADAYIFTITDEVKKLDKKMIEKYLVNRNEVKTYARFLSYRELLQADSGQPYNIKSSTAAEWRLQDTYIRLYGSKCKVCGKPIFPVNRVCYNCGSVDKYETFRAADRTVQVFTYTLDNYAGRSDFPLVGNIVADDFEGARYYLTTTDFRREDIQVGANMEFTFRKIHNLAGFVNYYWKLRPLRRVKGGEQ